MKWYERPDAMTPPAPPKPPAVVGQAKALLGEPDVVEALRLDPEALAVVQDMSRGKVPRNAQTILKALELRLRYSQALPKQTIEHQVTSITVVDPYAEAVEAEAVALPPMPDTLQLPEKTQVTPRPPVRRKRGAPTPGDPGIEAGPPAHPVVDKISAGNVSSPVVKE